MRCEIDRLLREIAGMLSAIGAVVSLLSLAEGLRSHSFNFSAFMVFCATWLILNALLSQFELEVRKLLFWLGIPASVGTLAAAYLFLSMS